MPFFTCLVLTLFLSSVPVFAKSLLEKQVSQLDRFSLASCRKTQENEPVWEKILESEPQLFLWTGDSYYADTKERKQLEKEMLRAFEQPQYARFRDQVSIIGTWDDHDYGWNDADQRYELKDFSQQVYLDFLEEPIESDRRRQNGIYTSYDLGDVKFILLDVRYHRKTKSSKKERDILGEAQWQWFEQELKNSSAKLHFIVSGTTFTPPKTPKGERWFDFPKSNERLTRVIANASGVVFLSGDVHFTGFQMKGFGNRLVPEFHVSGLTHNSSKAKKRLVKLLYPKGDYHWAKNFGEFEIQRGETLKLFFQSKTWSGQVGMRKSLELLSNGHWRLL